MNRNSCWLRIYPLAIPLLMCCLIASWTSTATAETHGQCQKCGRLVVISPKGAGLNRDWKGCCGKCYLKKKQGWFDINEHRYVLFKNGTMIDMKHFRGSMLLSLFGSYSLGGRLRGIAFANAAGWLIEFTQAYHGHPSGHPFGGNEDLLSNFAGSVAAQTVYAPWLPGNWAQQAVPALELLYGKVSSVTDKKKEK
ncbi:MAG: hypothetical protein Tsb009_15870 [Planctomycetaceae bacterium]